MNTVVSEVKTIVDDNGVMMASVDGEEFDWCINCTYNQLNPITSTACYYEVCLTLVYRKKTQDPKVVGITVMDGDFCSLYPYVLDKDDLERGNLRYTLTHVTHTPLMRSETFSEAEHFLKHVSAEDVDARRPLFEEGISYFYPAFGMEFDFDSWFVSMKTKPLDSGASNQTASRECIAERDGKVIRVLSGKINTLFEAERLVLAELLQDWSIRKRA